MWLRACTQQTLTGWKVRLICMLHTIEWKRWIPIYWFLHLLVCN